MAEQSMIERVARALHEAHKPWCDYTYPFDELTNADRLVYEALACAAMKAMREPTHEMVRAGQGWHGIQTCYQRMIDAVLPNVCA